MRSQKNHNALQGWAFGAVGKRLPVTPTVVQQFLVQVPTSPFQFNFLLTHALEA